jgi:hypothetical protein
VRDVGDGAFVANEIVCSSVAKMFVQDAIEPFDLVLVAGSSVLVTFGRVANEVVCLALPVELLVAACVLSGA